MQTEDQKRPTIEQIAANPAALANLTDEQIDALAGAESGASVEPGEIKGSEPPAAASQPNAEPDATATQPEGVQARDGKHVIPYSVLERERDRAARAEATSEALALQLKQLQDGGNSNAKASAENVGTLSEEDLVHLEQDLPAVAKAIRAQMAMIDQLNGDLSSIQKDHQAAQKVEMQAAQDEVEAAIAANPNLSAWRASASNQESPDPLMWNRAADLDAVLREDNFWKDRPIAERLAKVAETIGNLYGFPETKTTEPSAASSQATLKAKAEAALAAATKAASPVPRSMGDIPGGSAPPVDEAAAMLEKSGPELTAEFMRMTPEQIEAKLSQLR